MEEELLRNLPDKVRIKIQRVVKNVKGIEITEGNLKRISELREALRKADELAEKRLTHLKESYGIQPREEWVWTLPEPAIIELHKNQLQELIKTLKTSIDQKTATITHRGKTYRLTLEYPCG